MPPSKSFTDEQNDAIRTVIGRIVRDTGASQRAVANAMGVTPATLSIFLAGRKSISVRAASALAESLGAAVSDLIQRPWNVSVMNFADHAKPSRAAGGLVVAAIRPPIEGDEFARGPRVTEFKYEPYEILEQRVFSLLNNRDGDTPQIYTMALRAAQSISSAISKETDVDAIAASILDAAREAARTGNSSAPPHQIIALAFAKCFQRTSTQAGHG